MSRIEYDGLIFDYEQIVSGEIYESTSLLCDALEVGTFQAELYITDEAIGRQLMEFRRNAPLTYYEGDRQVGIWFVESVGRTGRFTYEIKANNAVGLLVQSQHMGGIYTGQTAAELVAEICTVPYVIKSNLAAMQLHGWLPVASRRDNLAQVLFAMGAVARVDQSGVLHIQGLYNGTVSHISEDRIFWGDKVKYESTVTDVSVLEHSFSTGMEETNLFTGTTQDGDVIYFNEPVHSLSASGITIKESGANYAVVSAGNGTITGRKYIHNTRAVMKPVETAEFANVIEVKTATLVSLVNSVGIAERLAAFYRCVQTMENSVVYEGESAGEVASFEHPYGGDAYGTIKSVEITLGNQKAVATEKTLIGYRPPHTGSVEYFDTREVLTGEGEWTKPAGVEDATVVCIGPGFGGQGGEKGEDGKAGGTTENYGLGGLGGEGGLGGRITMATIDLTNTASVSYRSGIGGEGGDINGGEGSEGSPTTFGDISSASGASSDTGYTDIMTGEVFAAPGSEGLAGARGGSGGGVTDASAEAGESLGENTGGAKGAARISGSSDYPGAGFGGGGGGAAIGGNGEDGGAGNFGTNSFYGTTASGGTGGNGGNAAAPEKSVVPGAGGTGGNGGGGGGGGGNALDAGRNYPGSGGIGGNGSLGGQGADGCIILYYRIPKTVAAGAVMDSKRRFVLDRTGRLMIV